MAAAKILLAISHYFEFGGLQRDMVRVARELHKRGAQTHILCGAWQGDIPSDLSVEIVALRALTNHGKVLKLSAAIAERRAHYDAVIGFIKMPHLDFYFGGDHCFRERIVKEKSKWVQSLPRYRHFMALEAAVFGPDSNTESFLIAAAQKAAYQRQWHTPESRCHLLPGGLNKHYMDTHRPDAASLQALHDELELNADDKVLLHVGSDFKRKGVDRLIRAAAALPAALQQSLKLVIVGAGEPRDMLALAARLKLKARLQFMGGRSDVTRFYALAYAMVHPAYIENTGGIILESLYMGVPVLCTEACGYAGHVRDAGGGLVCPEPFVQETLNAQLQTLLTHPDYPQWRAHARRYCEQAPVTGMIEAIADRVLSFVAESSQKHTGKQLAT